MSAQKIRAAMGVSPGDLLPSREEVEERLDKVSGVLASRVEAACCLNAKPILYVGIEEREAPHIEFHPAPTGGQRLPAGLFENYQKLLENAEASIRGKNADEDLTNGYSLMADPESRLLQLGFIPSVGENLMLIDQVIRQSSEPEQRAGAAYLLQYGPRGPRTSKVIADALQFALRDQEDTVRENAMQALRAVSVGAKMRRDQTIHVEPTWFVELMNSVVWSDRRDACLALVELTEGRNPETMQLLRERALPSVIEMARWKDLKYALPPFILAGRLAGLDENAIKAAWVNDREAVLRQALRKRIK